MKSILNGVRQLGIKIFGQMNWTRPAWLTHLTKNPLLCYGLLSALLLLLLGSGALYYYQHLPKPILPIARIEAPKITPISDEPQAISPLYIQFAKPNVDMEGQETMPAIESVAPLTNMDKDISTGIHLSPELPGVWHWNGDNTLLFSPTSPWPAGQTYQVTFDPKLFAPHIRLAKYTATFSTQPLNAKIQELRGYQNPLHPDKQEIVGTIVFNYPIDEQDFPQQVSLQMQQIKDQTLDLHAPRVPLKVTFGKLNRVAYIHSDPIPLATSPQFMVLVVEQGLKTQSNLTSLPARLSQRIMIPDASHLFKITDVKSSIVRDLQGDPQQVLTVTSSLGATPTQLQQAIKAYILPKDFPATQFEAAKENYAWSSPDEVNATVLQQAKVLTLTPNPADRPYPTLNSFQYHVPDNQYLYVHIDSGLPGYGGFLLKESYHTIIKAPSYPKEISFLHPGALLALGGEHKLSVLVRGIPAVKFDINRVLPHEINHLVSQTEGNFNDPYFSNYHFDKNDISEAFSEINQFNDEDPARAQYMALDLDKYLAVNNHASPLGLFLVSAKSWDLKNNQATGVINNRLILVTDMGLIVKTNQDGSQDVYIQSIKQGVPVTNATVDILGKNGIPIATSITDAQGHAHFPSVKQFTDSQEPTVFLAHNDQDVSFMPYQPRDREINYSRFNLGGITDNDQNLSAYVFSDRGLYRPGDVVNFGLIIKQAYARAVTAGLPLEVVITDPTNKVVLDEKLVTSDLGLLNVNYQTSESSPTGDYTLTLYIIKDNYRANVIGATQIRVAEFLPDTLKISSQLTSESQNGWVSPNKLGAHIQLQNLIGTPAAHRKVTGRLALSPKIFKFNQYPDYFFNDPLNDAKKTRQPIVEDLPEQQTDDQGKAQFEFNLERFDKATYQLMFYVQGFEADSGRGVSTQNKVLVSPLEYLIGYKPDGDLKFIQQNSERRIHLLAINQQLQAMALSPVTLELIKQNTVATLVQKEDGTYQYDSVIQELSLNKTKLDLTTQGAFYSLPSQDIGHYVLAVIAPDGTVMNRIAFSVVGSGQTDLQKNAELTIKCDKEQYQPGEDIQLQITAPYSGSGLITIERDKVYAFKWFNTTTNNTLQSIHIPEDLVGNAYVNITFVRDWNAPEIYMSPLSFSVAPFTMDKSLNTIHINLQIPDETKPGKPFPIQYHSDQPGKIIIFAVDEGILQAANYTTPDPLNYFFQQRALTVSTTQIVDQILPKYLATRALSAVGGDGANPMEGFYLNPFKRKVEQPVVFWSNILDTDSTSRTVSYTVPDYFNGRLRVMAVAVNDHALGSTQKSAYIHNDFVMIPNLPLAVAPGDVFDMSVNVTNYLKGSGQLPLTVTVATTPGLEISAEKSKKVVLGELQEQVIHFTVKAMATLGNATVTFTVTDGQHENQLQSTLSVRPATPYQISLQSGVEKSSRKTMPVFQSLYPALRQQNVVASSSPIIFMQGLQLYLDSYPYGCTEQVVSQGFGYLSLALLGKNDAAFKKKMTDTVNILRQRHTSQGGFLYWPGSAQDSWDSHFASVYALHFLTEARDRGYLPANELLPSGLDYLRNLATQTPANLDEARLQAYAIYLLTRSEVVTTNYLTNLQLYLEENYSKSWRGDIASSFIAATYKMLKDDKTAGQFIQGYQLKKADQNNLYANTYFFSQDSMNALYVGLIAKHFPQTFQSLAASEMTTLADNIANNQIDTTSAAYTMLALSAYTSAKENPPIKINQWFANKTSQPLVNPDHNDLPTPFSAQATQLEFINPTSQPFFYQIYIAGYEQTLPTKPVLQGLDIVREYWNEAGPVSDVVQQGSDLTVHLKIRSVNDQHYTHIAIVDLLPTGFEWVPNSLQGEYSYYDAREDRVVIFATVDPSVKEITYHIKPTVKGEVTVPPAFAENMYNQRIMAKGIASRIKVQ